MDPYPLTLPDDWASYHADTSREQLRAAAGRPCVIDSYLLAGANGRGSIFELGCGGSEVLVRAAVLGWRVGGIDFNAAALAEMREFGSDFVEGDALTFDTTPLAGRYDLVVSFGFIEHFRGPAPLIRRWLSLLKPEGRMITSVPNLRCLNAWTLRTLQRPFWDKHVVHTTQSLDQVHVAGGARVVAPARLCGRYDIHWLTPWDVIQRKLPRALFLGLKLTGLLCVQLPLSLLPHGTRLASTRIMGVYARA
jgi:SAM-dependent methyltransferase